MTLTPGTDALVPRAWKILRTRREAHDTSTLELVPVRGEVPSFLPGQFNMLYAFGIGEIAISMSGDPDNHDRIVHTVRSVGPVSEQIASLADGDVLGLRGPFGTSWPLETAKGKNVMIIAGGLGLAPLRPAVYAILAHRAAYKRVALLIGMRDPASILYRHEIDRWRTDIEVEVTVDHADNNWQGHVGVVLTLVPRMGFDPANTIAMVCGPEVMMRFTVHALKAAGLTPEQIYLSMERNMKCAIGLCGHCQFGPEFVCKNGPVMRFDRIAEIFAVREI